VAVQPFVFGETHHLIRRPQATLFHPGAAARQASSRLRCEFVGVQLVAEQDQRLRPVVDGLRGHPGGVHVQRIEPEFGVDLLVAGLGVSARSEDRLEPVSRRRPAGADDARREWRVRAWGQTSYRSTLTSYSVTVSGVCPVTVTRA
jgi:hypothetical protein